MHNSHYFVIIYLLKAINCIEVFNTMFIYKYWKYIQRNVRLMARKHLSDIIANSQCDIGGMHKWFSLFSIIIRSSSAKQAIMTDKIIIIRFVGIECTCHQSVAIIMIIKSSDNRHHPYLSWLLYSRNLSTHDIHHTRRNLQIYLHYTRPTALTKRHEYQPNER